MLWVIKIIVINLSDLNIMRTKNCNNVKLFFVNASNKYTDQMPRIFIFS